MINIDVFIPCYNYGRYLERCVNSVLSQDGVEVRVLIIDDASTDASLEEAHRLAALDPRVSVLAHPVNKGHIATYNEGIAWASAPYMMLVSADDLVAPLALRRGIALMEEQPGVGFVFGPLCQFDDSANNEATAIAQVLAAGSSGSAIAGHDFIASICRWPRCLPAASGVVVRTELQQRVGGYLPELPHAGDFEMWLRLAAHSDVGVLEAPTALTRVHTTNMRHAYYAELMIGDYRQRALAFHRFFDANARQLADAETLSQTAIRSLAKEVLVAANECFDKQEGDANVVQLIALAQEIDPTITRTALRWKTVVKRTVGWQWCQRIAQGRAALQRLAAAAPRGETSTRPGVSASQPAGSSFRGTVATIQEDAP